MVVDILLVVLTVLLVVSVGGLYSKSREIDPDLPNIIAKKKYSKFDTEEYLLETPVQQWVEDAILEMESAGSGGGALMRISPNEYVAQPEELPTVKLGRVHLPKETSLLSEIKTVTETKGSVVLSKTGIVLYPHGLKQGTYAGRPYLSLIRLPVEEIDEAIEKFGVPVGMELLLHNTHTYFSSGTVAYPEIVDLDSLEIDVDQIKAYGGEVVKEITTIKIPAPSGRGSSISPYTHAWVPVEGMYWRGRNLSIGLLHHAHPRGGHVSYATFASPTRVRVKFKNDTTKLFDVLPPSRVTITADKLTADTIYW